MINRRFLAVGLAPLLTLATAVGSATAAGAVHSAPAVPASAGSPITHVIEIMIENHTFDNLFGSFPGADGIPAGTSFLNPNAYYDSAPNVSLVWATPNEGDVTGVLNNSRVVEQMAMNYTDHGYLMDHYTTFPQDAMASITEFGPSFDPNEQYLATNYELSDQNFQPLIAPTQPNVMTALNGTAHNWYYNNLEPGQTPPWNSIFDELNSNGHSWKIYYALPTSILNGTIWDQIIPPNETNDLTTGDQFFSDISKGALPDFSFVRPGVGYSTEAPEDLGMADAWIGQLVSAVAHSQYWNNTAIFVTYDEGGGFWDHVAPSAASGYGTRTPMIIISPYARAGVFHEQTTNVSVLSFMQTLWNLPALTTLNAQQNNLMDAFDFTQTPRPAPAPPVNPADTLAFHGTGGILYDINAISPGGSVPINLMAESGGLSQDTHLNGTVKLTVTPPSGVTVPSTDPTSATLSNGQASFSFKFTTAGYYRIEAQGPNGSVGWVTVDVGVNANTVP